jgi:Thioredoxin-like
LLEVGGDWCIWCLIMDNCFHDHPKLEKLRDSHYVRVKIYFGTENPNSQFLSQYPRIPDYPHFFVLDSHGKFLHSQATHGFEHGKTYKDDKIASFLKKWEPGSKHGNTPDPPETPGKHKHAR